MSENRSPFLSLVVCTMGRPHCVVRLLEATLAGHLVPDEILIVDASDQRDLDRLARAVEGLGSSCVKHLPAVQERGLTRQRNVGIRASRGELIAFLDDDCVPDANYFAQLVAAAERNPQSVGFGGWVDEGAWQRCGPDQRPSASTLVVNGWYRRLGTRWRLRRKLGLAPPFAPGRVPEEGHGWPISYLAPDTGDVAVDCLMGGASLWRRSLFREVGFSRWFEGYGLYEDLDFCLRSRRFGELVIATAARVQHLHEPSARPRPMRYGRMVLENGWKVWRSGFPTPALRVRLRWWSVSALLTVVRAANAITGPARGEALLESVGRCWGAFRVLINKPSLQDHGKPPLEGETVQGR